MQDVNQPVQLSLIDHDVLSPDCLPAHATVEAGISAFNAIYNLDTDSKVRRAMAAIDQVFEAAHPVAVAYSAGKDSTVLLYLVLEVARLRQARGASVNHIIITHANTGIENPAYARVADDEITRIRTYAASLGLPLRVDVVTPSLNDSWAVRIISGRALPTFPNSSKRDCSYSWKVVPQERQRKAALAELAQRGQPVVMTGTRFDESDHRFEAMMSRGERDTEIWLREVRSEKGAFVRNELQLSPICFFSQEDVWVILAELQTGERTSFTDAKDIWEAYRDGGGTSCAVVSDDAMKASAKACGARFGCALCAAVGRDKSLESMIDSDPKYEFMRGLNRLQRFIVDTQYDASRRQWVGRSITKDGYLAIGPDAYSPAMQRELLRYALTLDRDERHAARLLGVAPRFTLVTLEQLIAIDIIWSMNRSQARSFEAVHIWEDVNERGRSFRPPEVDTARFLKKLPSARWLYVGESYDSDVGYSDIYSGGRSILADLVGATEAGSCRANIELGSGHLVRAVDRTPFFEVDAEGAELFMLFTVGEERVHEKPAAADPGEAFRVYQGLGTFSTSTRHLVDQDYMLRRADWRRRHGVEGMGTDQLLALCVSDGERATGVRCPVGMTTLAESYQRQLSVEHAMRERVGHRPKASVAAPNRAETLAFAA